MNGKVLYISYDGLMEPLGQSQVLQYLKLLAKQHTITLITYEKPVDLSDKSRFTALKFEVAAAGIDWRPLTYHKRPSALATAYDLFIGLILGAWLVLTRRVRIIHARSYVPSVIALCLKSLFGVKYIFDMRGFWADERVDGGLWPRDGRLYKVAKWFERRFFLNSDHVISLTHAAIREIESFEYLQGRMPAVTVISTCADLSRFRPMANERAGFVLGYVGTVGTWYLFDEVVACFRELKELKPEARLLVVNRNEHDYIRERLHKGGVPMEAIELTSANPAEVPEQMARMHAGIFFIKPVFSKQASAPTKLGEFLGCGIPCLGNAGVGDMAEILESERVGVALTQFDRDSLVAGLHALLHLVEDPETSNRCVKAARRYFSLEDGAAKYAALYQQLSVKS